VAAIHDNDQSIPVNYHDLPQALCEKILPHYLQVPSGPDELARMQACATHYSKGHRKDHTAITFRDDSKVKEGLANEEVLSRIEPWTGPLRSFWVGTNRSRSDRSAVIFLHIWSRSEQMDARRRSVEFLSLLLLLLLQNTIAKILCGWRLPNHLVFTSF
jgi:hypothetical protein